MTSIVLDFREIEKSMLPAAGGKCVNLAELSRIEGILVPKGFCVTAEAYQRTVERIPEFDGLLDHLSKLSADDRKEIADICGRIREAIEGAGVAKDIEEDVALHLARLGEEDSYAVRSSATAEDLPRASFAGLQDSYLNIRGKDELLRHLSKCWASLFTDRAVMYRMQNGFDHRTVRQAVAIQRMVFPQASGVMFTADPATSNRKVLSIDSVFGLGEALVSGLVNSDLYKIRSGRIIDKRIAVKKSAVYALKEGGAKRQELGPDRQGLQALTDGQILELEGIGRKIEAHFGRPQDIEWCLAENAFHIVQSRPITTLYPLPATDDGQTRVFMSIGHPQMMTGDIKPLGMSFFEFLSDIPLSRAGGRLFLDVSGFLASPIGRRMLPMAWAAIRIYRKNDPSIIKDLVARNEGLILDLQQRISAVRGVNLFDFILEDLKRLKDALFYPPNLGAVMAGMFAADGINASMEKWLGEKNAAHALSKSVANNITSEMGLALLDVADIVRRHPDAIEYLRHAGDETLFAGLKEREGGEAVAEALRAYLDKYGMRCPGEIDITRPRLSERPAMLIPLILNEVRNLRPNARNDRFERGRHEAQEKERELLGRLELLPGGRRKAKKAGKMIAIMRNFVGYREYPKYFLMKRFNIYKNALMKEAETLVQGGVIREKEDVFYLTLGELREAVRTNRLDCRIITRRKEEYSAYEKMTPPRVMTSEGEIVSGEYGAGGVPAGALAGLPVSAGVREGRARVVLRMQDADLEEGDILVTEFADPGWTPLFVSVSALVTEAGGLMSHGSVIAREYGLPAVAGVENATRLIKDGQRIRVNGTEGYVEILSNGADSILP